MPKNPEAPTKIEGKITCVDGQVIEFQITPDVGWQQWGNTETVLYRTTELMDSLHEASHGHLQDEIEDDDEEDDDG